MGLFSSIKNFFGGGESKSRVSKHNIYTPQQQEVLKLLSERAKTGLEGDVPTSPSSFIPATGGEQSYLDWSRGDLLSNLAKGEVPYETGDQYVTDFMEAYRPVWERARNEALDLARGEYAGPTYWGSARAEKLSDLGSEWGEKYAMTEADLRLQEDQARRKAIDEYQRLGLEAGSELAKAGALERAVEEARVSDMLNRFLRGEQVTDQAGQTYQDPVYNQNIQLALALLGYSPYTFSSETKERGPGLGYGMLTGIAQGVGSSLF